MNVHINLICNNQNLKATYMSNNMRTDTQKNGIIYQCCLHINFKMTILSKINKMNTFMNLFLQNSRKYRQM